MTHPDLESGREARKQGGCSVFNRDFSVAILALGRGAHLAAQMVDDEVEAIADAQYGRIQGEQTGVGVGRVRIVH